MNQTLTKFRQAVRDSTDLQKKVKAGVDLVVLGEENGYRFTQEEVEDYLREVRNSYDFTQDEQQIWLERIG